MRPSVASLLKITCTFSTIYNRHHGLKLSRQFDGTKINTKVFPNSHAGVIFQWSLRGVSGWLDLIVLGSTVCRYFLDLCWQFKNVKFDTRKSFMG